MNFADWNAFGVKAANVAELTKLSLPTGTTPVGYAVPFYFYDEFMKQATVGTETILGKKKAPAAEKITLSAETTLDQAVSAMLAHSYFQSDSDIQEEMLDDLRKAIKNATSPAWVVQALNALHGNYPDGQSLRYRSSTNNEDLPSFNGAGLYDSKTQDPDETTADGIDKSIKAVWASLWNHRAFLERDFHRVDHSTVAMGVLVHPNYSDERVNGVAVSYDPITLQDNAHYVNSQVGEDLVTNPEAYSQPEQLLLGAGGSATVLSRSNLTSSNQLLMSAAQMTQLRSNLDTIHNRFKTLYQVQDGDDFAIEIEFKITAANQLAIKQARPWIFPEPLVIPSPEVSLALGSAQVTEGESLELTVTRSGGIQSTPLTVNLAWSETGAALKSKPAAVTIPGNQTSASVTVRTDDDQEDEHDSVAKVSISADSAYTIGAAGSASATIADDDQPMIGVRGDASTVTEGSSVGFTFTRSGSVLEQALTVSVTITESGSRLQGTAPTAVTFAANSASAAISLPTSDDSVRTNPSVVTVQIDAGSDYGINGSGQAKVTIEDDEMPPPDLLFDFNHAPPEKKTYILSVNNRGNGGDITYKIAGPDASYFTDYTFARLLVMDARQYNHAADANHDGVYEIDLTASDTRGGTTTERLRFTVVNDSLIERAKQRWDQLSEDQRVTLLPEVEADGLKPEFASLTDDVRARVLRLARQQLLPSPGPTISVAGGSGVTEGSDATFTVTAVPSPTTALSVSVTVSQSGDYGASTGAQTVSIPTSGTYTLTVPTSGDSTDEPDGSVTATLNSGTGYTVSTTNGAATVAVADDDDPPPATPVITIAAGSAVTEGSDATFTVTASPNPASALTVNVTVSQTGSFAATTGADTVTIPTTGSATFTVSTTNDTTDEADGSVTATVNTGTGYTVSSSSGTASVAVSDDDDPLPPPPADCVSDETLESARDHYNLHRDRAPGYGRNWRRVLIAFGDVADDQLTAFTAAEALEGEQRWFGWKPFREALECIEAARQTPPAELEISIVAGSDVAEGTAATFVLTASPTPASALSVSVTVSQSGNFGAAAGSRTVTIPTTGTFTLTVDTTGDSIDEADGSVTATIDTGTGYTVSSSAGSATVAVADDDDPAPPPPPPADPEISITAGSGVTEGSAASFTLTASPAPKAALSVSVTVAQSGSFGVSTGARAVTIPAGGSYTLTVATADDSADEADGSVTATISDGAGYTVSSANSSAAVAVADDDVPQISIAAGSDVTEGTAATFTVAASPVPAASLVVSVTVSQSGNFATTGVRTFTIPTTGSATFTVVTTDDTIDEADGSVTATVGSGTGYTVSATQSAATVAVSDDDDPPPPSNCVSDETLESARNYYDLHRDREPGYGRNWRRVLVAFGDVVDDQLTAMTAAEALEREQLWFGWRPFREALECIETARQTPPPPAEPEISIAAGGGVTEGSSASFTLTASPVPAAALSVEVSVSQSGDFGVTTGSRTVTIPTTGSYTLTVDTTGDSTDEADGSVTVSVDTGTGYTVSSSAGSASVAVADDDSPAPPPQADPEISIAAGSGVTEGGAASFTLTASPAPTAALLVSVTVAQSGSFGVSTGAREVTIPTGGSYTLTVATANDSTDEADGSVTATIGTGTGYIVSSTQSAATVAVSDDDDPPPPPPVPAGCVSDEVLESARVYFDLNRGRAPSFGRNWRRVLVAFGDVVDDQLTAFTAAEALEGEQIWFGWKPFREALECIEAARQPEDPEISIAAGSAVTEGTAASFTVTASPNPAASLDVTVTVSQSGDYGATTGARTVTIPTTGSYTLTVATADDTADEADGSVTVTIGTGTGYAVSSSDSSATVAVADNDVPEVSIAAGSDVAEGAAASFTITASPVPAASVDVSVTVSQSGDFAATGERTVTIPTTGTATFTVATADDTTDEADGSVTATISDGTGYTVSSSAGAATVAVSDDDDPAPPPDTPVISIVGGTAVTEGGNATYTITASPAPTAPLTISLTVSQNGSYHLSPGPMTIQMATSGTHTVSLGTHDDSTDEADGSLTVTVDSGTGYTVSSTQNAATVAVSDNDLAPAGPPTVTVSDATAAEDAQHLAFVVTLSKPNPDPITFRYGGYARTATLWQDWSIEYKAFTLAAGDTTIDVTVPIIDDDTPEDDETLRVYIYATSGIVIRDGFLYATGTITDDD
ncbi:PEP/pyruvate-binding domain-containing protein [Candidatus Poriferisodalis sp.]|uniref:PEP/pyruvate-binding domain-containing protein n=1 Tax=Candidatus Poriferisodalis sp. TaxID=3101277 RepID=UPI003B51E2B1